MSQGSSSPALDVKRLGGNAIALGAGDTTSGTLRVQLSTESLAALENISVTVPGTVNLGEVSLTALETITVEQTDHSKFKSTAKLTDGTNLATVKAASTAAVAGDTALVVAISPNNTVAATQSGTWNITNVSGTVSLPTGAATAENQSTIITAVQLLDDVVATAGSDALTKLYQIGGSDGTKARTLSVTSAGAVNIADGGNSITVDGTVGVSGTVAVTDNSGSLTVDAPVGTPVFVRLSDGQSAISTLAVSLATVPSHAVTNEGTFAVQESGAALTALQLLDDAVIAGNTAIGSTKMLTVGGSDGSKSQILSVTSSGAVNVADGGGTLSIDDGGGAITVDGTVAVSGSVAVTGTFYQETQPVSLAAAVAVTDNSGSLTVDAPVGTPVYVRLSNGSQAVDTLPVSFTAGSKSNASTSAYAASLVIKNSAGTLYMLNGYNSSTSDQWIQLHDASSLPGDEAAPKLTFLAPAESNFYFDFGMYGRAFAAGIVVCNSSTGPTKTIGSANCWFDAQYA